MKKVFAVMVLSLVSFFSYSQVKNPVAWTFAAKKINATTYEVSMSATLEQGWHIYSQTTPEGGPAPTIISFAKNPLLSLEGEVREVGKMEQKNEPLFGVDVKQFSNKVVFVQQVKIKGKAKTSLTGSLDFMTCNNRECLPPKTQKFSIALK
jgi:hypothetical protein